MPDQYEVLTEALTEHAKTVDGLAGRLAQAVDAAREVSLPTGAYGMYGQSLTAMLNSLQQLGVTALDASARRLSTTATDVKHTALDYAAVDDGNARALQRMRGLL